MSRTSIFGAIRDLSLMDYTSEIQKFYEIAFKQFNNQRLASLIELEFYKYVGLRHTIRLRGNKVLVRLSDLMANAPLAAHQALALILVAKLLKRRVPKSASEIYQNFVQQPQISQKAQDARRQRGRKIVTSEFGHVYNLSEMFDRLNQEYFRNELCKPTLSWSKRQTFRIFGHHDALHDTIIISKTLDSKRVPQFVVEFVLYHELLHVKYPTKIVNGRRQIHTAAFQRDEQKFPFYEAAEKWLKKLARRKNPGKNHQFVD